MKNKSKSLTNDAILRDTLPDNKVETHTRYPFPIVGIGASAGGLEALEHFFSHTPATCEMAFVVIQHLDPTHKGMLPELLQRMTEMKVHLVTDRLAIEANCVYVIPPNKSMSILNGSLHLFEPIETRGLRLPVDFFFRSLAEDRGEQSIGIILSGMGSDGSSGLKMIKEKGGLALIQDPASAKFDSMPNNAIKAVVPDIVANVDDLPAKLITITGLTQNLSIKQELEKDPSALEKVIILLRGQSGHDFSQYKKSTLYRRIERRMGIHEIKKIDSYVRYLRENPAENEILFKELLIGVTGFFRDAAVWEQIKEKVLPSLIASMPSGQILRAWIPACSTGEEAYTLAIVFKEVVEQLEPDRSFMLQIFATDLDTRAIETARKGVYPLNIVSDVSPERLGRFFKKEEDHFRVKAEIREMVVFAPQNVIRDPPFTKLHILSCRNLLIYLNIDLQKKLLAMFHYCLTKNSFLLLGSAETHGPQSELFSIIDSKLRIYKRSESSESEKLFDFPMNTHSNHRQDMKENNMHQKVVENVQTLTDQLLLHHCHPASVLATDKGDILYITGRTGKYLEPAAGKTNINLFAMAREELRSALPGAFRKAGTNFEKFVLHNVRIASNGHTQQVDVVIQQIETPPPLKGRILVIFIDVPDSLQNSTKAKKGKVSTKTDLAHLEHELHRVQEELQSTREEMQTSQEELESTNEELQSTNEEMQSTNEELTTSKEEMQSLNEELHTVNAELQSKVDEFVSVNNDMNNLLNSIEIATLFLDRELNIRQYTTPATKIFKLIKSDIGRPYTDQNTDLIYPEMLNDAKEVVRTLVFIEKSVPTRDGRWFNIRIMPYRTHEEKIDGLVITFVDITTSKRLEHALRDSQTLLRSLIQMVPGIIIGLSAEGAIIEFNPEAEKLFGAEREQVIGKKYINLFIPEPSRKKVDEKMKKLLTGALPNRYEHRVKTVNNDELTIVWSAHNLAEGHGTLIGIMKD